MDLPTDRRPRRRRDRDDRDAALAGPPGAQARVRRRLRIEGGAGRLPHRDGRAPPAHRLPRRAPRCERALAGQRHGRRLPQRLGRRGRRHRRSGRRRVHRPARAVGPIVGTACRRRHCDRRSGHHLARHDGLHAAAAAGHTQSRHGGHSRPARAAPRRRAAPGSSGYRRQRRSSGPPTWSAAPPRSPAASAAAPAA